MKISYKWLQQFFDETLPPATEIEAVLGTRAFEPEGMEEVSRDTVLDFDVLPNRAHDCLSHCGIAREVRVLFNRDDFHETSKELQVAYSKLQAARVSDAIVSVRVENTESCRRYCARIIENIEVKESPAWLRDRLTAIGQRSINNVVDATNYVMFETGQPLHAFDAGKVSQQTIVIRNANFSEKIHVLGGQEVSLLHTDLVIADTDGALAIAGVKGGVRAELDSRTTSIIIESANFHPVTTRKTARRIPLLTDASKRFENEPTPELAREAIDIVAALILDIASTPDTKLGGVTDIYPNPVSLWSVSVSLAQINNLLGTDLDPATVANIFTRFGFGYKEENGVFDVQIPAYRLDLKIPEDLIEEIGRVYGYENIPSLLPPTGEGKAVIDQGIIYRNKVRNLLVSLGFDEIYTYSFVETGEVEMQNLVAEDKKFVRAELAPKMRESLLKNLPNAALFGKDRIMLFEIGKVHTQDREHWSLCIGVQDTSSKQKPEIWAFLTDKIKNIFQNLSVDIDELHRTEMSEAGPFFKRLIFEIDFRDVITTTPNLSSYSEVFPPEFPHQISQFHPFSKYPFISRDIAVWLPNDVLSDELVTLIKKSGGSLLATEPRLLDTFEKEGRVSYAYRFVFQSQEKTLSDDEVAAIMDTIYGACKEKGWEVR